ncbi:MAG: hypothetical protein EOO24_60470 [Comamonadaceae bacterium]|nr:MAG: hypothetical protein EOO24_60470 [Comamonadaceae bacterium]
MIVAHSQGSVIVADLLRYLHQTAPPGWQQRDDLFLFTCGSPLRQLYAARFPGFYAWVEAALPAAGPGGECAGPQAGAIGVRRWTNVYCTGDYVGRWLWGPPAMGSREAGRLAGLLFDHRHVFDDDTHRQLCLGKGAHTHYFDLRMAPVARELDALLH